MGLTLTQAAERSGLDYQILKKAAQRGTLRSIRDASGHPVIEEEDLDAFSGLQQLGAAVVRSKGEEAKVVARDLGGTIARLPQSLRDAILDGIPQGGERKRTGGPEAYRKAMEAVETHEVDLYPDDPHHGFPVGHIHDSEPRWSRSNSSTWILGDASYSWNGMWWDPAGAARPIGDGISPASPFAEKRPMAPSKPVPIGKRS